MLLWQWFLLFGASFLGGAVNAIAGGGTLLTFPALLGVGFDPKIANATSTVALVPGALSSAYGYKGVLSGSAPFVLRLFLPSLLGGATGALLVLLTPSDLFNRVVPFLILFATLLFTLQERLKKKASATPPTSELAKTAPTPINHEKSTSEAAAPGPWAVFYQFLIAVYGGYFGAGLGILLLVGLGFLGVSDIHRANGLKSVLGGSINAIAALGFIFSGLVHWPIALWMALGAIVGGYVGAQVATRIPKQVVRGVVILFGFLVSLKMLFF